MSFIDRLMELLVEKGLSNRKFLNDLNMGKNQINYWINHPEVIPNHPTLEAIARYLNVNIEYLTGEADERTTFPLNEDDIKVALFGGDKEVTPEMWQEVQDYIEFIKHKYFKDDDNAE